MLRLLCTIGILLSYLTSYIEYSVDIQSLIIKRNYMHCHLDIPTSYMKDYKDICNMTNQKDFVRKRVCSRRIYYNL